jgi:photosystem II stability/assembly factor-like uncharacterized protein
MKTRWQWSGILAATLLLTSPLSGQPQQRVNQTDDPLLSTFTWREIGPVGQGGRVNDIAVVERDPRTYYVAFAGGGLFRTENNGVTFEDVFGGYGTSSVGAVAVSQSNPAVVYVGTGEANNRQSSTYGDGVYRSTDGGRSFAHAGLRETMAIARIVVHPANPDIVWVAAAGALFGANPERGVYKSVDGGRDWKRVLYENEHAGATELIIDPSNPNTLFAALYQRQRTSFGFVSGGPGSGIFRSDDGGETWSRVRGNGLPNGTFGRVAMDFARSNPNVVYAQIEVAPDREPRGAAAPAAQTAAGQPPPPDPQFSGVWRSNDGGRSWSFMSNNNVRPMYFSIIRADPTNPDIVYTGGVQAYKSVDGGRNWETLRGFGHVDHHAIWINPQDGNHVMLGNDGSIDVSWDQAATWESLRTWSVGQPYHASVDMQRPYNVCTGLQDNGSWCGPSSMRTGPILAQDWFRVGGGDGFYTAIDPTDPNIIYWESQNGNINRINLRDGSGGSIRPRPPTQQNPTSNIAPVPEPGTQVRWNWNTPFVLSPHNPSVVHAGGNRLFKSYDRGDTWVMGPDLTKQVDRNARSIMGLQLTLPNCGRNVRGQPCILSKNDGIATYGTIVSLAESPMVPGVLWVGTDDGNIQVSHDGGATWTEVGRNIRGGTREYYISRVEASHHDAATAYVSIDGHRSNDMRPYVYATRDFGRTWESIAGDLPVYGNVNTVRQDPRNPRLLYAGTEFGFFVTLDEGRSWKRLMTNLATVRVDDVLVHPRDNDLVLATHGRGVAIMDDISPLQQLTPEVLARDAYLFEPREAVLWRTDRRTSRSVTGAKNWTGSSAPVGTSIAYYLKSAPAGAVRLTISDVVTGQVFREVQGTRNAGLNRVTWNLRGNPVAGPQGQLQPGPLARPGSYRVVLSVGGAELTQLVTVLDDIWLETLAR